MSEYFPRLYERFHEDISVKLDLSSFATKADLKRATMFDTSDLAAKTDLACLKADVDKVDVEKLKTVPTDLSKLSNVVDNDVAMKPAYDKLVKKVNAIDASGCVLKTQYDTDKSGFKKKIRMMALRII